MGTVVTVAQTFPLVSAQDPRLRWVGRSESVGPAVRFAWSGSGFIARFRGTGLACVLRDPMNLFTLVVDGVAQPQPFIASASDEQPLTHHLPRSEHTVELLRRSEPLFGASELLAVRVLDGELLAAPPRRATIELIGDSISCGYGNETNHPSAPFTAAAENHYRSYGAILARALDAELSTIAWSGRGVVRNYGDAPDPLMPDLYGRTLPLSDSSAWAFEDDVALVVVNVGTNDFTTPGPDLAHFVAGYVDLLSHVRKRRPQAPILCVLGPMLAPLTQRRARAAVESAVTLRQRSGDTLLTYYPLQTPNRAPGCNEHPSVATHEAMAQELLDVARALMPPIAKRMPH